MVKRSAPSRTQAGLPIPRGAVERVVARHPNGARSRSEYLLRGEVVAEMHWEEDGLPWWGFQLRDGKKHGLSVEWYPGGEVSYIEAYAGGHLHGPARQLDETGKLLLETRYVRGTGVDLWCDGCPRTLSEERHFEGGSLRDVRWWNADGRTIHFEEQYRDGKQHGIFREWNREGRPRRGFPRYFVRGERVDKRTYLRRALKDPTLPRYLPRDDDPRRKLPAAYIGQPIHRERRARADRGGGRR